MKLCVSNIGWHPEQDSQAFEFLSLLGINCLELAPTRWWPDLSRVSCEQIARIRGEWCALGLKAVCFQSVLYGRPDLAVFNEATNGACLDYLLAVVHLASRMGVSTIVFGSPKNRVRGSLSTGEARENAVIFFRSVGKVAADCGVRFCFEPNPPEYGADFGCTTEESVALAEAVDSPGFLVNIDAGAIALNREDAREVVRRARGRIGHVHISEPYLATFSNPIAPHNSLASALSEVGYDGFVSLEMRPGSDALASIGQAIAFAKSIYPC